MRLLQRLGPFKPVVFAIALVPGIFFTPASAEENGPPRQPLFSCGTDVQEDAGYLWLSGIELDFAVWDDLRFERIANGTGETVYSFPPDGTPYKTAFLFSHSDGPEGYLVSIRWRDGDTNYVFYSLAIPPDPAVEDDMGGGDAGLVISKDGKLIERISCEERPYMFISYMRGHMSCDEANPYGPAACAESSYERTVPLDVETIGLVR